MLTDRSIWLSELFSIIVVGMLLITLLSLSAVIFFNSGRMHHADQRIDAIRTEAIALDHELERLGEEHKILALLRRLAGNRIADSTLCRVAATVGQNAAQFGYDPLLLLAVIRVESVFDPEATGRFRSGMKSGAIGLMQLKIATASEVARRLEMPPVTEKDLVNPETNLVLGVAYLTRLISRFKSFKLGLLAYNQGPGMIIASLTNRETLSIVYYQKVLRSYYRLKDLSETLEKEPAAR